METEKNKSRNKVVDFESGSRSGLRRARRRPTMMSSPLRMNRLNGVEGFDPKRNQTSDIKEAGIIQPDMLNARYSVNVSCRLNKIRKTKPIKTWHSTINSKMPKITIH
jgi:hypothetical protein